MQFSAVDYFETRSFFQCKGTMSELCDLQVRINGQQTFFLSEGVLSKYSGKLRKIIKQEKRRTQIRNSGIEIDDFPGGPDGFELVSRFCYNNGSIPITVSNVSLLHCCAVFLGMSEKASRVNLLHQTEVFLEGIFYWSWNEILTCLKNCDPFFSCAESCGLVEKLLSSLLAKIAQNSDVNFRSVSSSSSTSSPDTTPGLRSPPFDNNNNNNNLVLTRFLIHYLKTAHHSNGSKSVLKEYSGLAGTAVNGVVSMGKTAFSCRGLFWVLRIVSGFGLSRERRTALERLIGGMLDQATLDDLLVSGGGNGEVYDVNLVVRLIRLFVHYNDKMSLHRMKKVGELIDMYLVEIGPDPNLKISKFVGVAQSLPDFARDSFDQVYRAIDIYLQSHPALSLEERSRLCRCLNYEKLSLETCKDLADNPRIPPRIAVQALGYQHSTTLTTEFVNDDDSSSPSSRSKGGNNSNDYQLVLYKGNDDYSKSGTLCSPEEMKVNKCSARVVELEKVCREMQGHVARMVKLAPQHNRPLPRLC
ncbi:UNVERIFIED_CONTAM: BTB/POZ domain-containing protein [Sesamum radiatum]|uniref:BTB/POZ domain-containing protein n=1 Tax=Sesamum radiatum TaxID=300843 RepID=A0AAW2JPF2_SESRA